MARDAADFATNTRDKQATRITELADKADSE